MRIRFRPIRNRSGVCVTMIDLFGNSGMSKLGTVFFDPCAHFATYLCSFRSTFLGKGRNVFIVRAQNDRCACPHSEFRVFLGRYYGTSSRLIIAQTRFILSRCLFRRLRYLSLMILNVLIFALMFSMTIRSRDNSRLYDFCSAVNG